MLKLKVVLHIIGFLILIEGFFILTGIPFSIYYKSNDLITLLICGLGLILLGFLIWILTKQKEKIEIGKREGYLIVSSGWLILSLLGALPFVLQGLSNYTDAFFETASGFTTTGASVFNDVESIPYGILFWRSMTHWLGGMGIIVLSIAILPLLNIGGMQLYSAEVPGPSKEKLTPRVSETAKRLWGIYILITFLETVLLMLGGMNLYDALCHSFGTVATGGFSTKNKSIAYYNSSYIDYIIIIFMFISGTNFTLHYLALHGKISSYFKDDEFKFYTIFSIIIILFFTIYLFSTSNRNLETNFRESAFSVLSILTSTGFVTVDYESWGYFFSTIFLFLLLLGACAGSTSGGIKMIRHYLLFKNSFYEFRRLIHPNAILPVRYNHKAISNDIISKISAFVLIYLIVFAVGSILLSIIGLDTKSAMGGVAACLGNIGPGLGSTGPATTYANVPALGKWLLAFIMIIGRLEIFTVFVIFSRTFWKR